MNTSQKPVLISLNRLCKLTRRDRSTLTLRLLSGELVPAAWLDVGGGRALPLFSQDAVGQVERFALRPGVPVLNHSQPETTND